MATINRKNNFIWLTLALIGMMLAGSWTRELPDAISLQVLEFSSIILMLVSLRSLRKDRSWLKAWITIIGVTLVVLVLQTATSVYYLEFAFLSLLFLFFVSAAWLVGSEVLLTGSVDINKIIGSIALYFLLGMIWTIFYTVLLEFSPEAMKGVEMGAWFDNMFIMNYFSFVTLTTLGFGDISPATPTAKTLVLLEAVTGMFYMAIVVASLIGGMKHKNEQLQPSGEH
jgi:hypothetical protein